MAIIGRNRLKGSAPDLCQPAVAWPVLGTRYWFNFANAEDDIIAPKTQTRGDVYETYVTHSINDHFIFKADYMRYNYAWSGSGWHLGEPEAPGFDPVVGFPDLRYSQHVHLGTDSQILIAALSP